MLAKSVITFVLLNLLISPLTAQQDSLNPVCKLLKLNNNWDFGAGTRFSFLDFDELNRSLESAGLPALESPLSCVDLNVRTTHSWQKMVMETGVKYAFGSSKKDFSGNRQSVTFRDYAIHSRLMFDVFDCKNLSKVFPYAGLGVSYQVLNTYSSGGNFSESPVAAQLQNRRFTYIPFSFETGVSAEQGFKMFGKNIFIGFRTGYAFRFFQTNWALDGDYTIDLPKPACSSPFVALILRVKSVPKTTNCYLGATR